MEPKTQNDPSPAPNVTKKSRLAEAGAAVGPSKNNTPAKRTLTAVSTLPIPRELPRQPYLTICSTDAQKKITELNLFKTGDALRQVLGYIPTNVQKLSSGALLVKCASDKELAELEKITTFGGIPCASVRHQKFNQSKGVVRSHELKGCSNEEIVANCEGVVEARRITLRRGETTLETNTVVLTFDSCRPPATVRASYLVLDVRPYVPNPLRCFQCQKFGHSQSRCRRAAVCPRCGKTGHPEKECKASPCCPNCHGQHTAFSKDCPTWIQERAIQEYKARNGCSFQEARKAVCPPVVTPVPGRTYANAARPGRKSVSTSTADSTEPPVNRRVQVKRVRPASVVPTFHVPLNNRFQGLEDEGVDSSPTLSPPPPTSSFSSPSSPSDPPLTPLMGRDVDLPPSPPPPSPSSRPPPPPPPPHAPPKDLPPPEDLPLSMEVDSSCPPHGPGPGGSRTCHSAQKSPTKQPPNLGRQNRKPSASPARRSQGVLKPGPKSHKEKYLA